MSILLVGHGSREQRSNDEFRKVAKSLQSYWSGYSVDYCYVELEKPSFLEKILTLGKNELIKKILIVPVFLFASKHVKNDIPIIAAKLKIQYPSKEILCTEPIKVEPLLIKLILKRLNEVREKMIHKFYF